MTRTPHALQPARQSRAAQHAGQALVLAGLILAGLIAEPASAAAQLISPGLLSARHAELDGIGNCTQCHELRRRGVSAERCLACHTPLRARIVLERGLHVAFDGQSCGECHKDHGGRELDMVRFDPAGFDHADTGYDLSGAHRGADCSACHNPTLIGDREVRQRKARANTLERTFLGLGTRCASCHFRGDPHDGQFERTACVQCHSDEAWAPTAGFEHDATAYALTGLHRSVDCSTCHREQPGESGEVRIQYKPIAFGSCASCHRDPHRRSLGSGCADCHQTAGWKRVSRSRFEDSFDHEGTDFALRGAHVSAGCASCHRPSGSDPTLAIRLGPGGRSSDHPPPIVDDGCRSCHVDHHEDAFSASASGGACSSCHDAAAWTPTSFDVDRHRDTDFPLVAEHRALSCGSCHRRGPTPEKAFDFDISERRCVSCHASDDPHRGQFSDEACESCHRDGSFAAAAFDHARTKFRLEDGHAGVPCVSCHVPRDDGGRFVQYRRLTSECGDCHRGNARP